MQNIYIGYMYSRWKKIRGLDKDDSGAVNNLKRKLDDYFGK